MEDEGRRRADGGGESGAWERTIEEMHALADERAEEGWTTDAVIAVDTAPKPPDAGERDRFGLIYTVGGDDADAVRAAHDGGLDRYTVYRRQVGDRLFLVTELQDTDAERALFVAGAVDMTVAGDLVATADERGELYSHLRLLDGTDLASVRHDDPGDFFPSLS